MASPVLDENTKVPGKFLISVLVAAVTMTIPVTAWVITKNHTDDAQNQEQKDTLNALGRLEDLMREKARSDDMKFETEKAERKSDNLQHRSEISSVEKAIKDLGVDMARLFTDSVSRSTAREWILRQKISNPTIVWNDLPGTEATPPGK